MSILHGAATSRYPNSTTQYRPRSESYDSTTLNRAYIELEERQPTGLDGTSPRSLVVNEIRGYGTDDRGGYNVGTENGDHAPPGRILRTVKFEQSDTWMT